MNKIVLPIEVVNEDGTPITDHPKNPLFDIYPQCKWEGYKCMYCGKCPAGEYFKVTELPREEQDMYYAYQEECRKYNEIHNPSLVKRVYEEVK